MITAPRIRFLKKKQPAKEKKSDEDEEDDSDEEEKEEATKEVIKETKPKESFNFMSNDDNFSFKVKTINKKQESDQESEVIWIFLLYFRI